MDIGFNKERKIKEIKNKKDFENTPKL